MLFGFIFYIHIITIYNVLSVGSCKVKLILRAYLKTIMLKTLIECIKIPSFLWLFVFLHLCRTWYSDYKYNVILFYVCERSYLQTDTAGIEVLLEALGRFLHTVPTQCCVIHGWVYILQCSSTIGYYVTMSFTPPTPIHHFKSAHFQHFRLKTFYWYITSQLFIFWYR